MDKVVLFKKANFYKGKELLIKEDEDPPPTTYITFKNTCSTFGGWGFRTHEALAQALKDS